MADEVKKRTFITCGEDLEYTYFGDFYTLPAGKHDIFELWPKEGKIDAMDVATHLAGKFAVRGVKVVTEIEKPKEPEPEPAPELPEPEEPELPEPEDKTRSRRGRR